MRMALQSKNKIKFVDGTLKMPAATDPMFSVWERYIWKDLKDQFSQGDVYRISDLQEEIYGFKQGEHSVTDYFTHLKILWDELENIRPIPQCTCATPCICEAFVTVRKYRENDYVIRFLKGLNDQFSNVRSQIMLLESLPSINRVFSLVVQQERHMNIGILTEPKVLVNKSNPAGFQRNVYGRGTDTTNRKFGTQNNNETCTYCGKPRHTEETCYRKHGFPLGFKFKNYDAKINNDLSTLKKIDTARAKDALYALVDPATPSFSLSPPPAHSVSISVVHSACNPAFNLWHFRLGHHSTTRLNAIKTKYPDVTSLSNILSQYYTQFSTKVKVIRSDNGLEFSMPHYYSSKGIEHQTTCVETPQQNAIVERKHQHILNVARALLFQANLPKIFRSYAVIHSIYLINRLLTPLLNNKSPYEILYTTLPDIHDLRVFGALCFASTLTAHRSKIDSQAKKCLFLSYKSGTKGNILFDLSTREIFISRHVIFYE
ncbi:uncharacterized protein LOC131179102 [Hevea brasiliensis]|uniref:uncharacterized protein LOC131179102 n=1 Tax=Hevea brasiliensis TaxID=3981 RepID=UPI0025E7F51B|nr:uncharacterized protein LOC131179102 [Hevea brasiliensis]